MPLTWKDMIPDRVFKAMEEDRIEQAQARGLIRLCGKSPIPIRKTQAEMEQERLNNLTASYSYYYQLYTSGISGSSASYDNSSTWTFQNVRPL